MKIQIVSIFTFLICVVLSFQIKEHSRTTGAPPSSTNAPGERNCTTSGCHDDYDLNPGGGEPIINFSADSAYYVPGQSYSLQVGIQKDSIKRFGFEVTSISVQDTQPAGQFLITDSNRTQKMSGISGLEDRQYITYTFYGTDPVEDGKGQWEMDWEAPASDMGPVTFYLATLAANNDGTEAGDKAYTTTLTIYPAEATGSAVASSTTTDISVYPLPVTEALTIDFTLKQQQSLFIRLLDLNGEVVMEKTKKTFGGGHHTKTIKINSLTSGIYVLQVVSSQQQWNKKIVVR